MLYVALYYHGYYVRFIYVDVYNSPVEVMFEYDNKTNVVVYSLKSVKKC